MIHLTKLIMNYCGILNTENLRYLINLEELALNGNNGIDITTVQYLTQLTKLMLDNICLINIDALRPLINLKELSIQENLVVYVQPLIEFNQLSTFNAFNNRIVDIHTIKHHTNFDKFNFWQKEPTQQELKAANIMRDINSLITILRHLNKQKQKQKSHYTILRHEIRNNLQKLNDNHTLLIENAVQLFHNMKYFEECQ
ncbi:leucine-rich_repeat domain-containing protein [Hexamita inflata]|uniref:Leucine-rich repeat domain-containing protein n=1 Tax=Hexamita inflata TaxID=28002 RepID=A0AA86PB13_9EUKA|nr:leucine-rich repeat domain-containing protein [Hexamita inflata]